jgi:hypothetical protein
LDDICFSEEGEGLFTTGNERLFAMFRTERGVNADCIGGATDKGGAKLISVFQSLLQFVGYSRE